MIYYDTKPVRILFYDKCMFRCPYNFCVLLVYIFLRLRSTTELRRLGEITTSVEQRERYILFLRPIIKQILKIIEM